MQSAIAVSYELDDPALAADELVRQIQEKIEFKKESIAILYTEPNIGFAELTELLHQQLGFAVIGGSTANASTITSEGYHELAVILHVLTADDCLFSAAISEPLEVEPKKRIIDTYRRALKELNSKDAKAKPKMLYLVASMLPGFSSDSIVSTLSKASSGLPVFGFMAADDFEFCDQQVFLNETFGGDRVAVLLIAGNVQPIFEVKSLIGSENLSRKKITKAHDNVICEIDNLPAIEYLKDFPFINDETTRLWNYQFFVELDNEKDNGGVSVSRALKAYDKEKGEISCFASVPENSYISLQYSNDTNVKESCEEALDEVLEKLNDCPDNGYEYSTMLISSSSLRSLFLTSQKDAEGVLVNKKLPASYVASGVYAFGEIAPSSFKNGKAINNFHNAAMVICAL
ncbi:MAG: FIST C-terminal domain-containing protein [Coriobacteriia bacterium]|nr:FIST C-terminal domain-containing protein [Coriobacteriia bacterium]